MTNSKPLMHIETPDEELDRLERELVEHELSNGFDFHAPCEPKTADQLREQAIAEFNEPEVTFDSPEWLEFIKDIECDEVMEEIFSETNTKH